MHHCLISVFLFYVPEQLYSCKDSSLDADLGVLNIDVFSTGKIILIFLLLKVYRDSDCLKLEGRKGDYRTV